jgi:hypothetical protein
VLHNEAVDRTNKSDTVDDDFKLYDATNTPAIHCDAYSVQCAQKSYSGDEIGQVQESNREGDSEQLAAGNKNVSSETVAVAYNNLDDPAETTADVNAERAMEAGADTDERPMDVTSQKVSESAEETITVLEPVLSEEEMLEPLMEATKISQEIKETCNAASIEEVADSDARPCTLELHVDNHDTAVISSDCNDVDTKQRKSVPQNKLRVLQEEASKPILGSTAEMSNTKTRITKYYAQQIFKDTPPSDAVSVTSTDSGEEEEEEEENTARSACGSMASDEMALDPSTPQKFSAATQTESTSKSDSNNDGGMMAAILDVLAKSCVCFRY